MLSTECEVNVIFFGCVHSKFNFKAWTVRR